MISNPDVHIVLDANDITGESIVWDAARQRLVWVDIGRKLIHRLDPATGRHETWDTPEFVTSLGLRKDGGAIVGLARRIVLWDFGGPFSTFAVPEPDRPANRFNEGKVGPDGSFWIGSMQNNLADDASPRDITGNHGALHRITPDGRVTRLTPHHIGISNTMVWLDDGRFVSGDTLANTLYAYDWDRGAGRISNRRSFFGHFDRGLPDGSCQDADGYIWNCRVVGGSALVRIAPDGCLDRIVDLPCSWPTSCCFGGPDLDTLYVTSARFTMTEEHLRATPQEGALMALDVGARGRPEHLFG
jgi:sugar lactone lactonase YvrE